LNYHLDTVPVSGLTDATRYITDDVT